MAFGHGIAVDLLLTWQFGDFLNICFELNHVHNVRVPFHFIAGV